MVLDVAAGNGMASLAAGATGPNALLSLKTIISRSELIRQVDQARPMSALHRRAGIRSKRNGSRQSLSKPLDGFGALFGETAGDDIRHW